MALIQAQGYHGTGLNAVVDRSGAPKGSLYFHFPKGKEELAGEAIRLAQGEFSAVMAEAMSAAESPKDVIHSVLGTLAEMLKDGDYRVGCPVSVVTVEAAGTSETLRQACENAFAAWTGPLAGFLSAHGHDGPRAGVLASAIVSMIEGAMITSRARRDVGPLNDAAAAIEMLVGNGSAAAAPAGQK